MFTGWKDRIKSSVVTNGKLQGLIEALKQDPNVNGKYYLEGDCLEKKGKLVVGDDGILIKD